MAEEKRVTTGRTRPGRFPASKLGRRAIPRRGQVKSRIIAGLAHALASFISDLRLPNPSSCVRRRTFSD
ncbi:unnamed protein product [Spirodela intermedia]|uniref:Uncharacterized protein n=1 Tax=Spirodela intermedia TaxID=51605 RepID=A0A7I8K566_SPIIN|nr:unnamed protein product [Spirodela intermedia]